MRLLNQREQLLLGAPARLKDAREVAALADLGDLQLDLARPGVTGEIRRIVLTRARLLLLGKGGVLAHRFDRPLAAESDETRACSEVVGALPLPRVIANVMKRGLATDALSG